MNSNRNRASKPNYDLLINVSSFFLASLRSRDVIVRAFPLRASENLIQFSSPCHPRTNCFITLINVQIRASDVINAAILFVSLTIMTCYIAAAAKGDTIYDVPIVSDTFTKSPQTWISRFFINVVSEGVLRLTAAMAKSSMDVHFRRCFALLCCIFCCIDCSCLLTRRYYSYHLCIATYRRRFFYSASRLFKRRSCERSSTRIQKRG